MFVLTATTYMYCVCTCVGLSPSGNSSWFPSLMGGGNIQKDMYPHTAIILCIVLVCMYIRMSSDQCTSTHQTPFLYYHTHIMMSHDLSPNIVDYFDLTIIVQVVFPADVVVMVIMSTAHVIQCGGQVLGGVRTEETEDEDSIVLLLPVTPLTTKICIIIKSGSVDTVTGRK